MLCAGGSVDKVAIAKSAFSHLLDSEIDRDVVAYEDLPMWDHMAEDVVWEFSAAADMPVYGKTYCGKAEILELARLEQKLLEKNKALDSAPVFIGDNDHVVVLVQHSYRIKKNDVRVARRNAALVMDFEGELISRIRFYEDMSEFRSAFYGEYSELKSG